MLLNYKTHDPKGWGGDPRRGAALGRPTVHDVDHLAYDGRISVRQIRLYSGGYDQNGTYFGHPPRGRLYWYANAEGTIDGVLCALFRSDAVAVVRGMFPKAKVRV